MSGALDARKWSAKWRNWNISNILLFEFNRGAKAVEAATNICAMYGDNAIGESTEENGSLSLRMIVLSLVTLHVQEDLRGLKKIV